VRGELELTKGADNEKSQKPGRRSLIHFVRKLRKIVQVYGEGFYSVLSIPVREFHGRTTSHMLDNNTLNKGICGFLGAIICIVIIKRGSEEVFAV
jgi:hypothetical protein